MKIVVLDGYAENPGDLSWDEIAALGTLTVYDRTSFSDEAEIIERIGDAEVVITNKTPVSRRVIDSCPSMKLIAVIATGYNVVDCGRAKEKGVLVANVPSSGTAAGGQFAVALLLEICCRVGHHDRTVHEGKWENCSDWCYWDYPIIELAGKTMGIIGFGRIGRQTGRIARAMGMDVVAYDGSPTEEGREIARYVQLDELLCRSDVIALHCPLLPDTKEIINRSSIAKMKDGVIIINNGRGPLVNERDLADALNCGKVYAAGVDGVSSEPIRSDNPLLTAKNCIITPHISWAAKESRQRIMDCTAENIRAYIEGRPINIVNL